MLICFATACAATSSPRTDLSRCLNIPKNHGRGRSRRSAVRPGMTIGLKSGRNRSKSVRRSSFTRIPRHVLSRWQNGAVRTTSPTNSTQATKIAIRKRISRSPTRHGAMCRLLSLPPRLLWPSTPRSGTATQYLCTPGPEWAARHAINAKLSSASVVKDQVTGRARSRSTTASTAKGSTCSRISASSQNHWSMSRASARRTYSRVNASEFCTSLRRSAVTCIRHLTRRHSRPCNRHRIGTQTYWHGTRPSRLHTRATLCMNGRTCVSAVVGTSSCAPSISTLTTLPNSTTACCDRCRLSYMLMSIRRPLLSVTKKASRPSTSVRSTYWTCTVSYNQSWTRSSARKRTRTRLLRQSI